MVKMFDEQAKKIVPKRQSVPTEVLRLQKLTADYLYNISKWFDQMYEYNLPYRMVEGFDSSESAKLCFLAKTLPPGDSHFIVNAIKFARTPWYERKEEVGGKLA